MAKYEGSPADEREDMRGQARLDKMAKGKKKHAPPMRKPKAPPLGLATPPGGSDEGFGGGDMGGGGMPF